LLATARVITYMGSYPAMYPLYKITISIKTAEIV
jgi:hypothetical protein